MPKCTVRSVAGVAWCGRCYEGLRGRRSYKGHAGYRAAAAPRSAMPEWVMLKRAAKEKEQQGLPQAEDAFLRDNYPTVFAFLTQTVWEDGARRKAGTIMLVAEGGMWKAWVHDQDGRRSAWLSGATVAILAQSIEEGLADDTMGWRADRR